MIFAILTLALLGLLYFGTRLPSQRRAAREHARFLNNVRNRKGA
jgi:hypothetical protein